MIGRSMHNGRVLLVAGEQVRGATEQILSGWPCQQAGSAAEAIKLLRQGAGVDLVLLAPDGDPHDSCELCRNIKFDARTGHLPVIGLLPAGWSASAASLLEAGADDCVVRTAPPREIVLRVERAIAIKHASDGLEDAAAVITALANAVEGKDAYTCGHVERVAEYAVRIGGHMGLGGDDLAALRLGGIVHDIGKVGVPDHILNKQGKLTDPEMAIMRRHSEIGHGILKPLRTFRAVLPIVRWHHERPNGTGYPDRVGGGDLPILPRIAAVADVFDALCTDRPYRKAFAIDKCIDMLRDCAARGELDGDVVQALVHVVQGQGADAAALAQVA